MYNTIVELNSTNGPLDVSRVYYKLETQLAIILSITGDYPQIKQHEQFKYYYNRLQLSDQMISKGYVDYNYAVNVYNNQTRKFPHIILKFEKMPYFGIPHNK